MAVFLCRWPNGDISIVEAKNKTDANLKLDEFDNADHAELYRMKEFLMDLKLTDDGALEINHDEGMAGFGEDTINQIMEKAYPQLNSVSLSDEAEQLSEGDPKYGQLVRKAVKDERERLWGKKKDLPEPKTEWAKGGQRSMRSSAAYADRAVEREGKKVLKKFNPPKGGKPH